MDELGIKIPKTKKELDLIKSADFDSSVSKSYGICDANIPILGSPCDKISTTQGILKWIWIITAIPALGFVIFVDLFGEWLTIVSQLTAEAFDGVPVLGSIFGIIEAGEFDDIIDFISQLIVFVYCGPVTLVGTPEYAEGFLEIFPFWTMTIVIWLLFIMPARNRDLARRRKEYADIEAAIDAAALPDI